MYRQPIRLIAAITVVASLLIIAASCGGSSSSGDASSSIDKKEFVKRATAICHREKRNMLNRIISYISAHNHSKQSEDEVFADAVRVLYLPAIEREVVKIRALGAPEGDEEIVGAILKTQEKAIDEVAQLQTLHNGRFGLEKYFHRSAVLTSEYGIPDCGNGEAEASF